MKRWVIIIGLVTAIAVVERAQGEATLELGLRSSYFRLHDSRRGPNNHFLGSLDQLKEEDDYRLLPFMNVRFGRYVALGLAYDDFRVKTWSRPDSDGEIGHSDGWLDVSGPIIALQCYYPNASRYTPFATASVFLCNTYFDHIDDWKNAGNHRYSHILDIRDEKGYMLGLGCDIELMDQLSLVLMVERTSLEVEATYYIYEHARDPVTFPLDHTSYRIGMKYEL